jgi:hypothetical protein
MAPDVHGLSPRRWRESDARMILGLAALRGRLRRSGRMVQSKVGMHARRTKSEVKVRLALCRIATTICGF